MVKILLDDIKSPKKNRCPFPTVSMIRQSTGRLITDLYFYLFGIDKAILF